MKPLKILTMILLLTFSGNAHAQFWKDLKKRAAEAAEETLKRKSEEKAERVTANAFDSVFNNKVLSKQDRGKQEKEGDYHDAINHEDGTGMPEEDTVLIASNFGFVPGTKVLFEDDFSTDAIGDFPAKWDTNSSGEIFEIQGEKWLKLTNDATLIPSVGSNLPENYTIEFDMFTSGLDQKTRSTGMVELWFDDNGTFEKGKNKAIVEISPYQAMASRGAIEKYVNGTREIRSFVGRDYREEIKGQSHFSIEVNGTRVRVWINTMKIVDVPRLIPEVGITNFKMFTRWLRDKPGEDHILVRNFKIAETGEDLRSKLLKEGNFSTNEIQFDSGSANISASSIPILNQIGQLLYEESSLALKIIGHTDADGSEDTNQQLSQQRAEAVKRYFSAQFGIDGARLETEGKGESQPVVSNDTPEHKAQNRRVEFIKQ